MTPTLLRSITRAGLAAALLAGLVALPATGAEAATPKLLALTAPDAADGPNGLMSQISVRVSDPGGDLPWTSNTEWTAVAWPVGQTESSPTLTETIYPDDIGTDQLPANLDLSGLRGYVPHQHSPLGSYRLAVYAHVHDSSTVLRLEGGFTVRNAQQVSASITPQVASPGSSVRALGVVSHWDHDQDEYLSGGSTEVQLQYRAAGTSAWRTQEEAPTDPTTGAFEVIAPQPKATGDWRVVAAATDTLATAASKTARVEIPGACSGVSDCTLVKTIDMDGDGKADQVGVLDSDGSSIEIRVLTAKGRLIRAARPAQCWTGNPYWGTAPLDATAGAEIVYGDCQGAHLATFRALTVRGGKLVASRSPYGALDWTVDASYSSNIGITRATSHGRVRLIFTGAFRHDSGKGHRTYEDVFQWDGKRWKKIAAHKGNLASDKGLKRYAGGWHVKGLRVFN